MEPTDLEGIDMLEDTVINSNARVYSHLTNSKSMPGFKQTIGQNHRQLSQVISRTSFGFKHAQRPAPAAF
jgi:hypothetical protein